MPDEACATSPEPEGDGQPAPPQGLVLVSTPIGNLGDLTPRAREALRAADLILCEDTRHTARLLAAIGVKARLQPLHEHNEDASIPAVLDMLRRGRRVALVSDAGVPLVSDPGYRLVRAAIAEGVAVGAVPGPNAGHYRAGAVGPAAVAVPAARFFPAAPGCPPRRVRHASARPSVPDCRPR